MYGIDKLQLIKMLLYNITRIDDGHTLFTYIVSLKYMRNQHLLCQGQYYSA